MIQECERIMILILDGSWEQGAQKWSKSGISICWRHLVTSTESINPGFFGEDLFPFKAVLPKVSNFSKILANILLQNLIDKFGVNFKMEIFRINKTELLLVGGGGEGDDKKGFGKTNPAPPPLYNLTLQYIYRPPPLPPPPLFWLILPSWSIMRSEV